MVLAPCSPPAMVCKENRKVRKCLGRDGVTRGSSPNWPDSKINHRPRPRSSCIPGVV